MAEQTLPVASGLPPQQLPAAAKSEAGEPRAAPSFDRILEDVRTKDDAVRSRFIDRATLAARRTMQVGSLLAIGATFSGADASRQPLDTSRAAAMTEVLTEARPMQAEPPYQAVSAERGLRAEDTVDSDAKWRNGDAVETDVILDAMLITERVPPGTPLVLRMGEIPDERIRAIVAEIDETLGGRIEWPNVYVTPGLSESGTAAQYMYQPLKDGGWTVTPEENAEHTGAERFGIHLDADLVDSELASCSPGGISIRALLVHEAQHAMSHDASAELRAAARENIEPYEKDGIPWRHTSSESRADLAMLVYAEMAQRPQGAGPRLNELGAEQRREIVRGVIEEQLTPVAQPPREVADERLYEALREDRYLGDPSHQVWAEASDRRTTRYVRGMDVYSENQPFVPTHKPDPERRRAQLATPLDELAERWQADRAARPVTSEEWDQQYGQTALAEPEYHEKGDDPNELTQVLGRLRQGCAPDQLGVGGTASAGTQTRVSPVSADGHPDRGAAAPPAGKTIMAGQADAHGRSGERGGPAARSASAAPTPEVGELQRHTQRTVDTQADSRGSAAPPGPRRAAAAPLEQAAQAAVALAARRERQAEMQALGAGPMSQLRGYAATAWARLQTAVSGPFPVAVVRRLDQPASQQRTLRQAPDGAAGVSVNTGSNRKVGTHGPPRSGRNADVAPPPARPTPATEVASAARRQQQAR